MNDACHHCNYDLIGLPDQGVCPECGEYYDKNSLHRAARANDLAVLRLTKWVGLVALTLMILTCGGMLCIEADRPWGVIAVTLLIAAVPGLGAFTYWWADRQEKRQAP